ncbi:MAG: hypothetical protein J6S40_01870 [Thermoguttaceae bacterium]|nr:hypothetical protein [Thermoguttaceae bacterium]
MAAWLVLLAGFFEVVWACAMKLFLGFTARLPPVMTVVGGIASILLPAPTGPGMIGAALCAALFFRERFLLPRLVRVLLIVTGITGLKFLTKKG